MLFRSLDRNELAVDINYNKSLQRLLQNIKTFRNNINAKFVKIPEQTSLGVVTYYALSPVSIDSLPVFSSDVENELVGVGVNELHIPQVLNREITKLFKALDLLRDYLKVTTEGVPNAKIETTGISVVCQQPFC